MSATIDASAICEALQAPLIESEGRMFPVETVYSETDMARYDIYKEVAATILKAANRYEGDILAFLPGDIGCKHQQSISFIICCFIICGRTFRSAGLSALRQSSTREAAPRHSPFERGRKENCARHTYRRNLTYHRRREDRGGFRTLPKTGLRCPNGIEPPGNRYHQHGYGNPEKRTSRTCGRRNLLPVVDSDLGTSDGRPAPTGNRGSRPYIDGARHCSLW